MINKTESKILKILEEELEAGAISKKIGLTYDTTSKHLKRMTREGKIKRRTGERPNYPNLYIPEKRPWVYLYSLNNDQQ